MRSLCTICIAVSMVVLGSCSERKGKQQSPIESYRLVDSETLQVRANSIAGNGRIQFRDPLRGINSNEHYVLEGNCLSEACQISLWSHFNGFEYEDGEEIRFVREKESFQVYLTLPTYPPLHLATVEKAIINNKHFRLRIEVHDGGPAGVRVILWNDLLERDGLYSNLPQISQGTAFYDSQEDRRVFDSNGKGVFWGLDLKAVELIEARRELSYVE